MTETCLVTVKVKRGSRHVMHVTLPFRTSTTYVHFIALFIFMAHHTLHIYNDNKDKLSELLFKVL